MIFWIVLFCTIAVFLKWITKKPHGFPPGPPNLPFVGALPFVKGTYFHLVLHRLSEQYGPVVGLMFGPRFAAVSVAGPAQIMEVLRREEFQGRPKLVRQEVPRPGIIFKDGDHWKDQRRFTLRHLRDFGFGKQTVEGIVLQEADEFFNESLRTCNEIQVVGLFSTCAINVIWAMIGGRRFSHLDTEFKNLIELLRASFRSDNVTGGFLSNIQLVRKLFPKWSGSYHQRQTEGNLKSFFVESIHEHRETLEEEPRDFIDVYLSELRKPNLKASFNEDTMTAVCMDLFTAGAETLGNSTAFCLMYLVLHPEWQDNLYSDIHAALGATTPPSLQDRDVLVKVEAFISEVARVNTLSPLGIPRRCTKDTHLDGHFVPKDSFVFINLWAMMNDKDHWGDPQVFRPERFINDDGTYKKDAWLLSFGSGQRACIGETLAKNFLFLFITAMVREFEFSVPEGADPPDTAAEPGFVPSPKPFRVSIKRRQVR